MASLTLGIKRIMDYQDYLKNGEWKDYSLSHYPDAPKPVQFWYVIAFFAIMTLGMAAGYLTGYFRSCFVTALIVVQWQHLGLERLVMAYALGYLQGGGYCANPLEVMACDFQDFRPCKGALGLFRPQWR